MQPQARIGVIGGTGLYDIEGLTDVKEVYAGNALRQAVGRYRGGETGRGGHRLSAAPRQGPPHLPYRGALPRQHLRPQSRSAWSSSSPPTPAAALKKS